MPTGNNDDHKNVERSVSHWPTPELPPAPVSAKTHGDPRNWTPEQWAEFSAWAHSLKDYGPAPRRKKSRAGVAKD